MERISDILQGLARRGRGEGSPLVLWHPLAASEGARVSHVPISQQLSHAWVKLTGNPFRPHQSLALATLRRGDAIALSGSSVAGAATARLLLFELLRAAAESTALVLLPDLQLAHEQVALFQPLNQELGNTLTIATVGPGGSALHAARARIVLTTPEMLHGRLLRYHDRVWQPFWRSLRAVWIDEADAYTGVAAAHLGALLLRGARLRGPGSELPQLIATLGEVADAEEALAAIWGAPWRLVPVDDMPAPATALAVWRGGSERLREAATIAQALVRAGYRTHLSCLPLDELALRQLVGDEGELLTLGTVLRPAQTQILVGYPSSPVAVRRALGSGAEATVLVLGDQPLDAMLARLPASLLAKAPPAWSTPPANAYVTRQHLLCAANERPISQEEVAAWQMEGVVAHLEQGGHLVVLPGSEPVWQPRSADGTPREAYTGFGLATAGGQPTLLLAEGGQLIDQLDAGAFDRWGFPGAVLPPGGCRYRVTGRDEERGALTLRPEVGGRRTFPLRRCQVTVRDEQEHATLRNGRGLTWGRVQVHEEIYGYREAKPGIAPAERTLSPPLSTSWSAHAVWIDVGITPATNGQTVGWSLVYALPLRALGRLTDLVPVYDVESRRLFLVDAQPGGNGLSAWVYAHLEELLPLAYDIALDCRTDPLLEPSARADMDWLLLLLGGEGQQGGSRERWEQRPTEQPIEQPAYARVQEEARPPAARVVPPAPPAPPERREPAAPPERRAAAPAPPTPPERRDPPPQRREPPAPPERRTAPPVPPSPAGRPAPPAATPPPPASKAAAAKGAPPAAHPAPAQPAEAKKGKGRNAGGKGRQTPPPRNAAEGNSTAPKAAPKAAQQPTPPPPTTPPADDDPLPPLPAAPPEPAAPAALPDASAMIAKMKQLRQQREQQAPRPERQQQQRTTTNIEPRFHPGDTVACMPYGEGTVRASRIEDDGEILEITFPDYGTLTIDPAVSLVRLVRAAERGED